MDLGLGGAQALVTGASSGIGAATARHLAAEGADLVIGWHQDERGATATAEHVRQLGRRALLLQLDVADSSAVAQAISAIRAEVPRLDVLVLNAGRNVVEPFETLTAAAWDELIRVNLGGAFYVLEAARPLLADGASVVVVSSVAAFTGAPHHAHYAAAKAGQIGLMKSAARALAPRIRVNAVAPGVTATPMGLETLQGRGDEYAAGHLLARRLATPDEIARVITFVASPAASFMYGATVDVNGGRDLR